MVSIISYNFHWPFKNLSHYFISIFWHFLKEKLEHLWFGICCAQYDCMSLNMFSKKTDSVRITSGWRIRWLLNICTITQKNESLQLVCKHKELWEPVVSSNASYLPPAVSEDQAVPLSDSYREKSVCVCCCVSVCACVGIFLSVIEASGFSVLWLHISGLNLGD